MRTISWLGHSPAGTWMTESRITLGGGNLNYDSLYIKSDVTSPFEKRRSWFTVPGRMVLNMVYFFLFLKDITPHPLELVGEFVDRLIR